MDKETLDYIVKLEVNNIKNIVFPTHNGKGVYVKVPLGNTEIFNKHGFRLEAAGIYEKLSKNIGSPFIIRKFRDGKFVHPIASFTDNNANYRYQEQFNVGELAYVYDKPDQNNTWFGLYYTEDQPTVKRLQNYTESYQKGELPLEYSIAVFGNADKEGNGRTISDFEITHGALVDDPAWNGSYVKGVCSGDMNQCSKALEAASMIHDCESKCDCPICKYDLKNSYQLSVASKNNDMSSQEQSQQKTNDSKTETNKPTVEEKKEGSPLGNISELFSNSFNDFKKEVKEDLQKEEKKEVIKEEQKPKEEKKEIVKEEKFDWDKIDITKHPKFQEITTKIDDLEKRERSTAIAETLLGYEDFFKHKNDGKEVDEDLFNETVKFWTDTKLKIDDFNKIKKYTYDIVKKHYDIIKNPQKQQPIKTEEPKQQQQEPKLSTASMKNDYEYNAAFKNQNKEEETNSELLPYWKRSNGSSSIVNNRNIL